MGKLFERIKRNASIRVWLFSKTGIASRTDLNCSWRFSRVGWKLRRTYLVFLPGLPCLACVKRCSSIELTSTVIHRSACVCCRMVAAALLTCVQVLRRERGEFAGA